MIGKNLNGVIEREEIKDFGERTRIKKNWQGWKSQLLHVSRHWAVKKGLLKK